MKQRQIYMMGISLVMTLPELLFSNRYDFHLRVAILYSCSVQVERKRNLYVGSVLLSKLLVSVYHDPRGDSHVKVTGVLDVISVVKNAFFFLLLE